MFDQTFFNIMSVFFLFVLGMVILAVWGTKRNNRKLDETARRLAELRFTSRRTVEEEAEMIKLESWLRRYENQRRPPDANSTGSS